MEYSIAPSDFIMIRRSYINIIIATIIFSVSFNTSHHSIQLFTEVIE